MRRYTVVRGDGESFALREGKTEKLSSFRDRARSPSEEHDGAASFASRDVVHKLSYEIVGVGAQPDHFHSHFMHRDLFY